MYQNIDNIEFKRLAKTPGHLILDVRTPKEVAEGIIEGTTLFCDINNVDEFEAFLKKLDKTKNYLVYCRSGARSAKACKLMEERGFTGKLYNLAKGIAGYK